MSLRVFVCRTCSRACFPQRALCPDCAGRDWRVEEVRSGVLEAVADRGDVRVGAVRTALGPLAIARVEGEVRVGSEVSLHEDGDVPVASA